MWLFNLTTMSAATAMMESAGVKEGFVKYLCLKNTLFGILVVFFFHTNPPATGGGPEDSSFRRVFCPRASPASFVVDQCFHADGDKGGGHIVMRAVKVGVG